VNDPRGISGELRPYVDRGEAEQLDRVGQRLEGERPVSSSTFRAKLHERLRALSAAPTVRPPRRLWLRVAACVAFGFALLGLAALGLAGGGPLAP
jgi:hypothetical protein